MTDTKPEVQKTLRTSDRISTKNSIPMHSIFKLHTHRKRLWLKERIKECHDGENSSNRIGIFKGLISKLNSFHSQVLPKLA